jgi:ABC-type dipeptide/oligopeptide/nickel transport system permease subunit
MNARQEMARLVTNPALTIGVLALLALVAMGIFGPVLAPHDPNEATSAVVRTLPDGTTAFVGVPPTMPDPDHWLGTDLLGRDQWSRILAGAWLTLTVVLIATAVRSAIGVSLGVASGWYGGPLARGLGLVGSGIAAVPQLVLAIMLVLVTRPLGLAGFIVSLALVGWPEIAEFLRAEARRARAQPFIEAARSVGARERRLIGTHLLSTLGPQLLTVVALEMGSVLLLLAELGLIGLFLSGATYLIGDFGRSSPLVGRVPEWGQMLGGIQFYAITGQLSTLLPAVFIVLAATAFGLLGDGLRAASDPFSVRRLRPATFGILAKVLTAALCFSAVGFVGANVRTTPLSMEEGRALAAATAQLTWPDSVLIAAVARYVSPTHGFERPDRLTYYYRNARNEVLRITYLNADRFATDVHPYETEDGIDFSLLQPLPARLASYEGPATTANEAGGGRLRADLGIGLVRAILTWPKDREGPVYTVTLGRPNLLTMRVFCCFDAKTGATQPGTTWSLP